jgi:hypothetical protein
VYITSRDAKACEQACKELNALGTSVSLLALFGPQCTHLTSSQAKEARITSRQISISSKIASVWSRL